MFPILDFVLDEMRKISIGFHAANVLVIVQVEIDLRVEIIRVDQLIQLLVAERYIKRRILGYGDGIPDVVDDLEFVGVSVGEFLHFGGRK